MNEYSDIEKIEEELRRVNRKLLNAERVQSDFLSNIKNEINNPLTSIAGLLKVVISNPADYQGNQKIVKMVFKEVHNLNFQMQNILTAAEIEAGQTSSNVTNFNVKEMIDNLVQTFDVVDHQNNHRVNVDVAENVFFTTDKEKLNVILANLISNAIKFNKEGEIIVIKVEVDDEKKLTIKVSDHGVGIEEENLKTIFDRFKQLDSGTRKEFGGHGLGLAVVHALISMMNGKFDVNSILGHGSNFIVTLPMIDLEHSESVFFDDDDGILFGTEEGGEETF